MKRIIGTDLGYCVFDPIAETVTVVGVPTFNIEQVMLVTNVTDGVILFNFLDPYKRAAVQGNVISILDVNCTAMSASDRIQVIMDLPAETPETIVEGRSTDDPTELDFDSRECDLYNMVKTPVYDFALERIMGGSQPLRGQTGGLMVEPRPLDISKTGTITGLNSIFGVNFSGMASAVIQLSGTWVGTPSWEATVNGGDWFAIPGSFLTSATSTPQMSTSGNNAMGFNVAGLVGLRARFTTYTSGACLVTIVVSPNPGSIVRTNLCLSAVPTIQQRATTYELNSYDTNLAAATVPPVAPLPIDPSGPAVQAAYAAPRSYTFPQYYPRLRVESAGSERLPFAQRPGSLEQQVWTPYTDRLIESLLLEIQQLKTLVLAELDCATRFTGMAPLSGQAGDLFNDAR